MDEITSYALRFPTGPFKPLETFNETLRQQYTGNIADLPYLIEVNTKDLSSKELAYLYRPEGWNINEVVHHLVDSHMNAFIRFKLALTEDNPTIKPYEEAKCVKLGDCGPEYFEEAKTLLALLHKKWVRLIESMNEEDFSRTYFHPESKKQFTLDKVLAMYSWHSLHHLAHIKQAIDRKYQQ